ncbi:TrmB family transcriptional regulator [Sphingosinicella sp. YJ22]|uniref:TrmB family transcriptional regulator n=1 Tax=Sphingosinicella sp. YJ22 TaxID=1104780 RepID=UPI00140820A5|nr:TrmB family transcriptional regulator [Sphingosinicella sp. YJ22]
MASDQEVESFIRATFRSTWSLETLLLLRRDSERWWTRGDIVASLRASDLVVSNSLERLCVAGLVMVEEGGTARYQPVDPALDDLVEGTEQLYARSPDAVRRMIVAATNPGITAFADSFRLKKD